MNSPTPAQLEVARGVEVAKRFKEILEEEQPEDAALVWSFWIGVFSVMLAGVFASFGGNRPKLERFVAVLRKIKVDYEGSTH